MPGKGPRSKPFVADWRDAVRDSSLPVHVKAVALVLSTYFDADGADAYPSIATLSQGASVARMTVVRAIRKLEVVGFLVVRRGRGRGSSHYRAAIAVHPVNHSDATDSAVVVHREPVVVHPMTHSGSPGEPEGVESVKANTDGRVAHANPNHNGDPRPVSDFARDVIAEAKRRTARGRKP